MKNPSFFILVLVVATLYIPPVFAHSISFADVDTIQPMTVTIYESDGTFFGTYNTSSQGIVLDVNKSYYLNLKPEGVDRFSLDPVGVVEDAIDFISNHAYGFLILVIILGLLVVLVKK